MNRRAKTVQEGEKSRGEMKKKVENPRNCSMFTRRRENLPASNGGEGEN
jgi:hypothetical protein